MTYATRTFTGLIRRHLSAIEHGYCGGCHACLPLGEMCIPKRIRCKRCICRNSKAWYHNRGGKGKQAEWRWGNLHRTRAYSAAFRDKNPRKRKVIELARTPKPKRDGSPSDILIQRRYNAVTAMMRRRKMTEDEAIDRLDRDPACENCGRPCGKRFKKCQECINARHRANSERYRLAGKHIRERSCKTCGVKFMGAPNCNYCDAHSHGKMDKPAKAPRKPKVEKVVHPRKVKPVVVKQMPSTWGKPSNPKETDWTKAPVITPEGITVTRVELKNWGRRDGSWE